MMNTSLSSVHKEEVISLCVETSDNTKMKTWEKSFSVIRREESALTQNEACLLYRRSQYFCTKEHLNVTPLVNSHSQVLLQRSRELTRKMCCFILLSLEVGREAIRAICRILRSVQLDLR